MTNSNRFIQGLGDDPRCKGYLNAEENALHLLRDCKFAKGIWDGLLPTSNHDIFYTLPLKGWLNDNMNDKFAFGSNWITIFAVTLWWIWRWRSERCFEDPDCRHPAAPAFIRRQAKKAVKGFESLPHSCKYISGPQRMELSSDGTLLLKGGSS